MPPTARASLHNAQGQIPNDIEQYAPGLPGRAAVGARGARAGAVRRDRGGARGRRSRSAGERPYAARLPAPGGTRSSGAAAHPAPAVAPAGASAGTTEPPPPRACPGVDAATRSEAPLPVALLGGVGGAFALALLAWAIGRRALPAGGPARHAFAETGYRAGGLWAEFRDWLRTGR